MNSKHDVKQLAFWIGLSLILTFVIQRLYLHLISPNTDLFIAGYNIHHLFTGAVIQIPAAITLILGVRNPILRRIACIAFGAGTAMVLDEIVFLIATDGSNAAYLTPISLWGAVMLVSLTLTVLLTAYQRAGDSVGRSRN